MIRSFSPTPLGSTIEAAIDRFFSDHPVYGSLLDRVCVALTGSFAYGLGGHGADVDFLVLCPESDYEAIRAGLVLHGRIGPNDPPEEDLEGVVGDYTLQTIESLWNIVRDYDDLDRAFVVAHLVHRMGRRNEMDEIVRYCRDIPGAKLDGALELEKEVFSRAVYAFLRSYQNKDEIGRFLARAGMVRSALRMSFLAEGQIPPYDKHLSALLPSLDCGDATATLIKRFLHDGPSSWSDEELLYKEVADAEDWRKMFRNARETPALKFRDGVLALLDPR